MSWVVALAVVPGLLVSLVLAYLVRSWAPRWGLVDQPGHRKVHARPVPFGGGLAIWAGVVLPLALGQILLEVWQQSQMASGGARLPEWLGSIGAFIEPHLPGLLAQSRSLWFFLAAGTVLMLLGLVDDARRLDWRLRITVELAVAAAIVFIQGWRLTLFVDVPALTSLVSVLWIVGLINSINFLDNMDGLAGGVSAIAAVLLGVYLLLVPEGAHPQLFVAGFLFLLVGAIGGFLWHNRPPARIFMGDAGSYFIGFCLAVMTILATFSGPGVPRHSILAPLCVLAVPLYDTASVICIRLRNGQSPFEGDTNHFSHRLVALGLSKTQAVLTIYLTSAACGLGALVLPQVNSAGAVIIALMIACLLGVIAILEMSARRLTRRS
jgi:UDP-GlcNAc:undecaprenyl-phosphate/decaprenyl-phosphate GlcNAc-1-phosphate transferase